MIKISPETYWTRDICRVWTSNNFKQWSMFLKENCGISNFSYGWRIWIELCHLATKIWLLVLSRRPLREVVWVVLWSPALVWAVMVVVANNGRFTVPTLANLRPTTSFRLSLAKQTFFDPHHLHTLFSILLFQLWFLRKNPWPTRQSLCRHCFALALGDINEKWRGTCKSL